MPYVYQIRLDCDDLGRRATVRARTPDGGLTDTVGTLVECDERAFVILDKRGDRIRVARATVVAAKIIPNRPSTDLSDPAKGKDSQ